MTGFIPDIESLAAGNRDFRQVLDGAKGCQLVRVAIPPDEESGEAILGPAALRACRPSLARYGAETVRVGSGQGAHPFPNDNADEAVPARDAPNQRDDDERLPRTVSRRRAVPSERLAL